MHNHIFVHIIHRIIIPIIIPVARNHSTHVKCASLFFPQKFGQKSAHYTWQNTVLQNACALNIRASRTHEAKNRKVKLRNRQIHNHSWRF